MTAATNTYALRVLVTVPVGDTRKPEELAEAIARELAHVTAEPRYLEVLSIAVEPEVTS